ncbi:MAG: tetratricopeptide repeat protein [Gammaproteobacteria bacterium]|nr:tetratricopeptide repeat protein [Gammaproteobacteria bacterium]
MTDLLTEEEQAERIKKWLKENGLYIALAIIVGLGSVVGWNYFQDHRTSTSQEAANLYFDFLEARGLDEPVEGVIDSLRQDHERSAYFAFALIYLATDQFGEEKYEDAIASLAEAHSAASDKSLKDMILTRKARIESEIEEYDTALETISGISTKGYQAAALEIQGDIYVRKGMHKEARIAYVAAKEVLNEKQDDASLTAKIASIPEYE